MKNREQARLVIRGIDLPELVLGIEEETRAVAVGLSVANEGATKAFNVRAYAMMDIVKDHSPAPYGIGFKQDLPGTIVSVRSFHALTREYPTGVRLFVTDTC